MCVFVVCLAKNVLEFILDYSSHFADSQNKTLFPHIIIGVMYSCYYCLDLLFVHLFKFLLTCRDTYTYVLHNKTISLVCLTNFTFNILVLFSNIIQCCLCCVKCGLTSSYIM